jgi:hypothetical protein
MSRISGEPSCVSSRALRKYGDLLIARRLTALGSPGSKRYFNSWRLPKRMLGFLILDERSVTIEQSSDQVSRSVNKPCEKTKIRALAYRMTHARKIRLQIDGDSSSKRWEVPPA